MSYSKLKQMLGDYLHQDSRASETRTNSVGTTTIEWTYDGLNAGDGIVNNF